MIRDVTLCISYHFFSARHKLFRLASFGYLEAPIGHLMGDEGMDAGRDTVGTDGPDAGSGEGLAAFLDVVQNLTHFQLAG